MANTCWNFLYAVVIAVAGLFLLLFLSLSSLCMNVIP